MTQMSRASNLPGEHNRRNAYLAVQVFHQTLAHITKQELIPAINTFPGTERRFEKLRENLYTDYAHHPTELAAAIQTARELSDDVVVVYQPHQDKRQREVADEYADVFKNASKVYWLPTYEPTGRSSEEALTPHELIAKLASPEIAEAADLNGSAQNSYKAAIRRWFSRAGLFRRHPRPLAPPKFYAVTKKSDTSSGDAPLQWHNKPPSSTYAPWLADHFFNILSKSKPYTLCSHLRWRGSSVTDSTGPRAWTTRLLLITRAVPGCI